MPPPKPASQSYFPPTACLRAVKAEAAARGMHVVDATCPLVSKVHREVLRFVKEGYEIIYIGHKATMRPLAWWRNRRNMCI